MGEQHFVLVNMKTYHYDSIGRRKSSGITCLLYFKATKTTLRLRKPTLVYISFTQSIDLAYKEHLLFLGHRAGAEAKKRYQRSS